MRTFSTAARIMAAGFLIALSILSDGIVFSVAAQSSLDEARALNARAMKFHRAGKTAKAIPLVELMLAKLEKALPADHPYITAGLSGLAGLYLEQGRLTEADSLLKRALAIWEKTLPAGHHYITQSINTKAASLKPKCSTCMPY